MPSWTEHEENKLFLAIAEVKGIHVTNKEWKQVEALLEDGYSWNACRSDTHLFPVLYGRCLFLIYFFYVFLSSSLDFQPFVRCLPFQPHLI
jgi:hypothetical protein